ncbi:MAG: hypothetical protein IPH13_15365 [Planctomycetes bacterium]|nr:hypothetical protein [Planctomycetota bacterium]MCC7172757.1 hypothetical protein [Planctomycetota bacterium]
MSTAVEFAPWVVVDDDGNDVLVVDATRGASYARLIPERDAFLGLLGKLRGARPASGVAALSADERRLLDELRAARQLVEVGAPRPAWAEAHADGTPFLRNFVLEVPIGADAAPATTAIDRALSRLFASSREIRGLVLRALPGDAAPDWERIDHVLGHAVAALQSACAQNSRAVPRWLCEVPVAPRHLSEEALAMLERAGRCRIVVRAPDDGGPPSREDAEACHRMADEGFECIVDVRSSFDGDVEAAVAAWLGDGRCQAVRLTPDLARGGFAATSASVADARVDRGIQAMSAIAARLGNAVQRSQPWRSILAAAFVPWPGTMGWSKSQARIHVDADGRFARSAAHARDGFFEPLERLLPTADEWARHSDRDGRAIAGAAFAGSPDCGSCGFAALCDRYGSPEVDLALRHGRPDLAAAFARLECEVRKDLHGRLLDSLREQARKLAAAGSFDHRTVVRFAPDTKDVTLETE